MPVRSAGLLLYRVVPEMGGGLEILLVHPGGPYWAGRDDGAWSVPKGVVEEGDAPHATAVREFTEELGRPPPDADRPNADLDLGEARLPSGKCVLVFARAGTFDAGTTSSNTFEIEWPRGSGRYRSFPEVDRAQWFDLGTARRKLTTGQRVFLDRLATALDHRKHAGTGRE
jgi:predicted NUDIX family NTP pyrophosphohydrolase